MQVCVLLSMQPLLHTLIYLDHAVHQGDALQQLKQPDAAAERYQQAIQHLQSNTKPSAEVTSSCIIHPPVVPAETFQYKQKAGCRI